MAQSPTGSRCWALWGVATLCVLQLLLEHGAQAVAHDSETLLLAAGQGDVGACRLLLQHGAQAAARDSAALTVAALEGHDQVCRLLVGYGAQYTGLFSEW